jgi:hypothetical protein
VTGWEKDAVVARAPWESDALVTAAVAPPGGQPTRPLIVVAKGLPVPEPFRAPANPNSAGKYPLGRRFTVGDEGVGLLSSPIGSSAKEYTVRVTKVVEERDRVEWTWNDGQSVFATDLMGNASEAAGTVYDPPRQFLPAELYVGNRWRAAYRGTQMEARAGMPVGGIRHVTYEFAIVARERITVPSGEFDAFRIEGHGRTGDQLLEEKIWVLPYFNFQLRWDRTVSPMIGPAIWSERRENVSARQFAIGS